jgi:5-methylcytosine-specific restriction endonuclease McrA
MHGPLSPTLRFEILERDHFTCQYCGRKAPDVVLHVDHRLARARGGTNDRSNLVTSCSICNQGKGTTGSTASPAVTSTSIED